MKLLKKVVVKFDSWREEFSGIFLGFGGGSEEGVLAQIAPALRNAVQTICLTLLGHLAARESVLSWSDDPAANLEASALRLLTYDIVERPHAGLGADNHCSTPFVVDAGMKRKLEMMITNGEIGAALLLEGELFANNRHPSDDVPANMLEYWRLCKQFGVTAKALWENCFKPTIQDQTQKRGIEMFVGEPYVFDNSRWMAPLIDMETHWPVQDCLGTSVLHVLLHDLGQRRREGVTPELARKVAFHCQRREHNIIMNPADRCGRSVIHIAAQNNLPTVVQALVDVGIDPDSQTHSGRTALHFAAALGYFAVCRILVNHTKDRAYVDKYGRTPLHYACRMGHVDIVKLLLHLSGLHPGQHPGIFANQQDKGGNTPLMAALLSKRRRHPSGKNGSELVCDLWGTGGVSRLPIRREANAYEELIRPPMVDIMNFSLQNNRGETALHMAVLQDNYEAVQNLSPLCASSINFTDSQGRTALCCAAKYSTDERIVKCLLDVIGIDYNVPDNQGNTPLLYASSNSNRGIAWLLNNHANCANMDNRAPWDAYMEQRAYRLNPDDFFKD